MHSRGSPTKGTKSELVASPIGVGIGNSPKSCPARANGPSVADKLSRHKPTPPPPCQMPPDAISDKIQKEMSGNPNSRCSQKQHTDITPPLTKVVGQEIIGKESILWSIDLGPGGARSCQCSPDGLHWPATSYTNRARGLAAGSLQVRPKAAWPWSVLLCIDL